MRVSSRIGNDQDMHLVASLQPLEDGNHTRVTTSVLAFPPPFKISPGFVNDVAAQEMNTRSSVMNNVADILKNGIDAQHVDLQVKI